MVKKLKTKCKTWQIHILKHAFGILWFTKANTFNLLSWCWSCPSCFHHSNHGVMKLFTDKGAEAKSSPLEVAEASDVVFTMLPSSAHVSLKFLFSSYLNIISSNFTETWAYYYDRSVNQFHIVKCRSIVSLLQIKVTSPDQTVPLVLVNWTWDGKFHYLKKYFLKHICQ